jgi:hypothetical protein
MILDPNDYTAKDFAAVTAEHYGANYGRVDSALRLHRFSDDKRLTREEICNSTRWQEYSFDDLTDADWQAVQAALDFMDNFRRTSGTVGT